VPAQAASRSRFSECPRCHHEAGFELRLFEDWPLGPTKIDRRLIVARPQQDDL
jgi:hypothetical protein